MASRFFQFGAGGDDSERFFRSIAPTQLLTTVNQVVSLLSMASADPASIPAKIDEILINEIGWMERAVNDAPDSKATAEWLGQKLAEGLDMDDEEIASDDEEPEADLAKLQASGEFQNGGRLNVRTALYFCWIALPQGRRTPAEAGRIVRAAISRQLSMIEELRREILES